MKCIIIETSTEHINAKPVTNEDGTPHIYATISEARAELRNNGYIYNRANQRYYISGTEYRAYIVRADSIEYAEITEDAEQRAENEAGARDAMETANAAAANANACSRRAIEAANAGNLDSAQKYMNNAFWHAGTARQWANCANHYAAETTSSAAVSAAEVAAEAAEYAADQAGYAAEIVEAGQVEAFEPEEAAEECADVARIIEETADELAYSAYAAAYDAENCEEAERYAATAALMVEEANYLADEAERYAAEAGTRYAAGRAEAARNSAAMVEQYAFNAAEDAAEAQEEHAETVAAALAFETRPAQDVSDLARNQWVEAVETAPRAIYDRADLIAYLGEPDAYDVDAIEEEATETDASGARRWKVGADLAAIAERYEFFSYAAI